MARLFNNHSAAVQHVTTWSATVLNEMRFGYMRGDLNRLSPRRDTGFSVEDDLGIHGMLVGGPNGRPPNENEIGFPTINIQGFNGFGDGTGGEGIDKSQTYQFVDNLTLIRGRHALKMGADIRRLMGDATSTNAPFGALDFTRDITGHAAAAFMLGYPADRPHAGRHSDRRHPPVAPRLLRPGRLAGDPARHREPRSPLRPQPAAEGHQRREPHAAVRSDPSGPVLWPEPGEVVDELYFNKHRHWAPRLGLRVPAERQDGGPRRLRRLQHGAAPRQHQHARARTRPPRACR